MVDLNTVCCMCGDVGFPEKLFRCARCFSRFQHTYCSNYYKEDSPEATGFCDWCRSEKRNTPRQQVAAPQPKKSPLGKDQTGLLAGNQVDRNPGIERGRQNSTTATREEARSGRSKSGSSAEPSSRPAGPRYKLLKDVLR